MQEEIVVKAPTTEALTPAQITQKAEDLGVTKTEMSFGRSFALSIMAGAFIAMGAMFFSLVVGDPALPFAIQRVLGGFLFCLGLILVVVAGAELFTGNTMIVMTAASKRIKWSAVWKNWIVVFFGNFLGALVIVGLVFLSDMSAFGWPTLQRRSPTRSLPLSSPSPHSWPVASNTAWPTCSSCPWVRCSLPAVSLQRASIQQV